jgi:hypothetical protein
VSLADYQALVDDLVRDKDQVIVSARRDVAIQCAAALFAGRAAQPRARSYERRHCDARTPAEWSDGISDLVSIEYPIGNVPTQLLDADAFALYTSPSGQVIRLLSAPNNGDAIARGVHRPHLLDTTHDTIPLRHQRALACLAAADLCGQLASYYASESAPTVGADVADHQGKTDRYRKRRSDLLE